MISAHWSFIRDTDIPKPGAGEVVMTKAWVERGLSLPCSEFFLSILNTYGLSPQHLPQLIPPPIQLRDTLRRASWDPTRCASSSLARTSSELENLRSSYQELETKLMEAEQKKEQAEKQLAEKNSEFIKEKEPLGYPESRQNLFPRDDLLTLAGDDCKDLISASRKICHNLSLKKSRTCELRKLVKKMDILPELVTDLQASSARGAAAMTLTMCLAHNPELDLDRVTTGVPPSADVGALLDAVSGYDTRIARRIRHEEFYDKVVLPATNPLKRTSKRARREARPAESGTQFTWTSSKDAPQEEPKASAATSEEEEESEEDVSSPAEDAKEKDPEGNASPSKEE
ncbi:hypothetical protein QYE76_023578 [Lolium multiflorum]|uniref:Transposase (putative) gypsy type domain-containing protein n=1 Tax=Lolium multiflorum TaxID=4521 RepID=A0AAD8RC09_LOLMU|nr:hypothetical protein QYE76_023578 [Lolium multiflorum]